jgi:hypothetical protein
METEDQEENEGGDESTDREQLSSQTPGRSVMVLFHNDLEIPEPSSDAPPWMRFITDATVSWRDFFLYLPFAIQFHVNSENYVELESLFNEAMTEDCTLRTRVLPETTNGKSLFLEMFQSLHRSIPDYTMLVQKSTLSMQKRLLMFHAITEGTRVRHDSSEYIYNTVTHGSKGVIDESLRRKAVEIERQGGCYSAKTEDVVKFYLNADRTRISKIVTSVNVIEVGPFER